MNATGVAMVGLGLAVGVAWVLVGALTIRLFAAWDGSADFTDDDPLGVGLVVILWPLLLGFVMLMVILSAVGRAVRRSARR